MGLFLLLLLLFSLLALALVGYLWTGLSSLTFKAAISTTINAGVNLTGTATSPVTSTQTISKSISVGTSAANNAVGGGDEGAYIITSVSSSSSASLDLTSITNIANTASVTLARVKSLMVQLLSATDDANLGTAASYISIDATVTNGFASQSGTGWQQATGLIDVPNGSVVYFGTPSAGGVVVDSTHKILKYTNADAALTAKVATTLGAGSS